MKTVVIKEFEGFTVSDAYSFDLAQQDVSQCIGCWSCWWKTPGVCTFKDLDDFYHQYITAEKAIYFAKVSKGFVSGNLKTLFDRMIPLYLPYVTYTTGESMHVPRYEKYPDIEFYYEGEFRVDNGHEIFEDYIQRVFYQFYSKIITIKPFAKMNAKDGKAL